MTDIDKLDSKCKKLRKLYTKNPTEKIRARLEYAERKLCALTGKTYRELKCRD